MASHWKGITHLKGGQKTIQKDDQGNFKIKPAALDIVWGRDRRYWRIDESEGTAELLQVCWLQMTGSIKELDAGTYSLSFSIEMRPDAFGWKNYPIFIMLKVGDKRPQWKRVNLDSRQEDRLTIPEDFTFEIKQSAGSTEKLSFGMYEIWREMWKGGMIIHEVLISKKNI